MPAGDMQHDVDPKRVIWDAIGDTLDSVEIFNNELLVAVYMRPEKTSGGIILPNSNRSEDKYQSKVGLVVKKGPGAFVDPTNEWFADADIAVGDWVVFKPSDGWTVTVNTKSQNPDYKSGVICRMLDDIAIRGRVDSPDRIW